jgi:hypothetical protein
MFSPTERERRMGLHLTLGVRGRDERGRAFTETTRSLNVSGGGLCFESVNKLEVGGRLALVIELPQGLRRKFGGRAAYQVRALVCRVEPVGGERYRVGARFLGEIAV